MATAIPNNVAPFTIEGLLSATGGTLARNGATPDRTYAGVCTDSRTVASGNTFVALRGERFDGHAYVQQAVAAGAGALVVQDESVAQAGVPTVVVEDTTRALGDLAHAHRRRWSGTVVAITGSAGKTTTKEFAAAALQSVGYCVHKSKGNLNNRIGVPMTLFELDDTVDMAVVEMGTSEPGEIATLTEIARPDVGVVTLVGIAHTEKLATLDDVMVEKTSLFEAVRGCVVGFGDDEGIARAVASASATTKLTFGFGEHNRVRLIDWDEANASGHVQVVDIAEPIPVQLQLLGRGAALGAAAALAIVRGLEGSVADAAQGLGRVEPAWGRLRPLAGRNPGVVVLDDVYNANPSSMTLAIDVAAAMAERRNSGWVAVLGDMKELGDHAEQAHEIVAQQLEDRGVRLVIACGKLMRAALENTGAIIVGDASEAAKVAGQHIEAGDLVLVKGSRSMELERVVEALTQTRGAS